MRLRTAKVLPSIWIPGSGRMKKLNLRVGSFSANIYHFEPCNIIFSTLAGKEYEISFYHRQSNQLNPSKSTDRKEETESVSDERSIYVKSIKDYLPVDVNCLSKNVSKFGFNEKLSKLIRIYDLHDFVLLTPYTDSSNVFASETAVKLLMSSFCIAAYNTRWLVLSVYHFSF